MPQPDRQKLTSRQIFSLSATVLMISLGLCGANFLLVLRFVPLSGGGPQPGQPYPPAWPGNVLTVTGVLELLGIAVGLGGFLFALWRYKDERQK